MGIEALYPYIAVAYGTFGIVFGVILWWKTQRRIDRTKSAIEVQVANAVTDISGKVDEKLGAIPVMPDVKAVVEEALDEFELPDIDIAPLMAKLEAMEQGLPDLIGSHIEMHIKSAKAVEAKQIGKALEDMGINFEGAANEAMQFAEAQLPPEMIAMKKLLTTKIPKAVREDNPGWAWILENARQIGGGMLMSRLQQRAGVGGVAVEAVETGWTPGARR